MKIFSDVFNATVLTDEYVNWIRTWGNGRNGDDLRFGQYLINEYGNGTSCPAVFYEESAHKVFSKVALEHL